MAENEAKSHRIQFDMNLQVPAGMLSLYEWEIKRARDSSGQY